MTKILLIGHGIAGALLAWSLQRRGVQVHIVEGNLPGSASAVAAGIVNPVTGKRFAKSWRYDEFVPVAQKIYQALESELGISCWQQTPTLRLLSTPEEANDWSLRCAHADYAEHLGERSDGGPWQPLLKPGFQFGVIRQSARVHLPILLAALRAKSEKAGIFNPKNIGYEAVEKVAREYDCVVFCEGWRAESNPFFPDIPFRLAKGEALRIRFPGVDAQALPIEMLKKTLTLVPLGDGTFWAGGTYQWNFENVLPSEGERGYLLARLQEMLAAPFEIIAHEAGIRPTMIDRRPVVERSKSHPNFYVFNGLGTKGALLAPFLAEELSDQLLL